MPVTAAVRGAQSAVQSAKRLPQELASLSVEPRSGVLEPLLGEQCAPRIPKNACWKEKQSAVTNCPVGRHKLP
eukprot:72275-Chlamydomonas_euryale.AAC.1